MKNGGLEKTRWPWVGKMREEGTCEVVDGRGDIEVGEWRANEDQKGQKKKDAFPDGQMVAAD